ncbi:roadblock/LC7 domain-containing protein [Desulfogranum marinum]|jgi:hypothetical protein|uniref:roadblock/LC7 domain-containing protein n=1 Tax=Desulfogranum marinum TaxID=453220 RepID=UPI001964BCCD|nr:roadblock/LC7 domain-containing protein [Desulfogranum marinum]MBM9514124.1 roadblock/LC7 domain-containing protein [Desulfogranum marinum]
MATVKDFLARINTIEGVGGCLLVKDDGHILAHLVDGPADYSSLIAICSKQALAIMETSGFSFFRSLSFAQSKGQGLHIFPLQQYYLGVIQQPGYPVEKVISQVNHLLSHVKAGSSKK